MYIIYLSRLEAIWNKFGILIHLSYYLTQCNTKECFGINDVFDEDLKPDIYHFKKKWAAE